MSRGTPARLGAVAAGLWLMAAPAVLGFRGAARVNDLIVGPVAVTLAVVATFEATRGVRRLLLPAGLWMVVAPWLLAAPARAAFSDIAVGLVLVLVSFVDGPRRHTFGGGWPAILRP